VYPERETNKTRRTIFKEERGGKGERNNNRFLPMSGGIRKTALRRELGDRQVFSLERTGEDIGIPGGGRAGKGTLPSVKYSLLGC